MEYWWQTISFTIRCWLVEPHSSVQNAGPIRTARLLAGLLLVSSVSALLRVFYTLIYGGNLAAGWITVGGCLVAYGLSRTRYYLVGAVMTLILLASLAFVNVLDGPGFSEIEIHASLTWMLLAIVFGSIFLNIRWLAVMTVLILAVTGFLPLLNSAILFKTLLGPMGLIGTVASLLLVMRRHLQRLEVDRQILLEQREARYRALFERTNDAVFILGMDGVHREVNTQAATLLGYTVEEMMGMPTRQVIAASDTDDSQAKKAALLRGEVLPIYERTFRHKNGHDVPVELSVAIVSDTNGRPLHIQSIARDIAERKRAEREREQLIEQLEAKNTELERFTYTVSHDLKSPLVTIQGFLGFLEKDLAAGNTEQVQRDIARIHDAIKKMRHFLEDLLALSRAGRQMGTPVPVALDEVANEAIEIVRGRLESRGAQVSLPAELPCVWGDPVRLLQVFQNLLDNAIRFMGGQTHPHIIIGCYPDTGDGLATIFVQDNGIGIAPEYQNKVFELFDQLDAHSDGSGIGLALVQRIIQAHGGRIWIASDGIGQGSTFTFCLPKPPTTPGSKA